MAQQTIHSNQSLTTRKKIGEKSLYKRKHQDMSNGTERDDENNSERDECEYIFRNASNWIHFSRLEGVSR